MKHQARANLQEIQKANILKKTTGVAVAMLNTCMLTML